MLRIPSRSIISLYFRQPQLRRQWQLSPVITPISVLSTHWPFYGGVLFRSTSMATGLPSHSLVESYQQMRVLNGCMISVWVCRRTRLSTSSSLGGKSEMTASLDGNTNTEGNATRRSSSLPLMLHNELLSVPFFGLLLVIIVIVPHMINQIERSINSYTDTDINDNLRLQDVYFDLRPGSSPDPNSLLELDARRTTALHTADVVTDVLNGYPFQNAISSLAAHVVTSHAVKSACRRLLKSLWDDLIDDPDTTRQVVALLNDAIQNEGIRSATRDLVLELINDEEIQCELTALVVRLGNQQEVLDATKTLLTESAHKALNDPDILDHSMEFATDMVGDDVVQRSSGEALRKTVTYAMRPSFRAFLSILGCGLVFVSISIARHAQHSVREGRIIDVPTLNMLLHMGERKMGMIGHACSTIVSLVTFPFRWVGHLMVFIIITACRMVSQVVMLMGNVVMGFVGGIIGIGRILTACTYAAFLVVTKIPHRFVQGLCSIHGTVFGGAANIINRLLLQLWSIPTNIIEGYFLVHGRLKRSILQPTRDAGSYLTAAVILGMITARTIIWDILAKYNVAPWNIIVGFPLPAYMTSFHNRLKNLLKHGLSR